MKVLIVTSDSDSSYGGEIIEEVYHREEDFDETELYIEFRNAHNDNYQKVLTRLREGGKRPRNVPQSELKKQMLLDYGYCTYHEYLLLKEFQTVTFAITNT